MFKANNDQLSALFRNGAKVVAVTDHGSFSLRWPDGWTISEEEGRSVLLRCFPEQAREIFTQHADFHRKGESAYTGIFFEISRN